MSPRLHCCPQVPLSLPFPIYKSLLRTQRIAGPPYMRCCFCPRMNAAAENGVNSTAQNGTPGISKDGSGGLHKAQQAAPGRHEPIGGAVMSPLTPSPRQVNGTWERPSQGAVANSNGHASTSERDTCLRWVVNIRNWNPWDDEWLFLLDLLPEQDQKEVRHPTSALGLGTPCTNSYCPKHNVYMRVDTLHATARPSMTCGRCWTLRAFALFRLRWSPSNSRTIRSGLW